MKAHVYISSIVLLAIITTPVCARKVVFDEVTVNISYFNKTAKVIGPENRDSFQLDSLIIPESVRITAIKTLLPKRTNLISIIV